MARRFEMAILTMALAGLMACSPSANLLRTPPPWIAREPVLPGYLHAIGIQEGRTDGAELAAQQAREEMSKVLQPMVLAWMEKYVVSQAGMINEEQSFYLKQILPAILDRLMLETQIEDKYATGDKNWVLLKLNTEMARQLVRDTLENDPILRQKMQTTP